MARYAHAYRFLREDVRDIERFLNLTELDFDLRLRRATTDRANIAEASPLEHAFEERFANVYGPDSTLYLWREYAITDLEGRDRYIDYLVRTTSPTSW